MIKRVKVAIFTRVEDAKPSQEVVGETDGIAIAFSETRTRKLGDPYTIRNVFAIAELTQDGEKLIGSRFYQADDGNVYHNNVIFTVEAMQQPKNNGVKEIFDKLFG